MSPDRFQKIQDLYLAALDRVPADRAAFLDEACGDDSDLRAEVESLLHAAPEASFLEHPLMRVKDVADAETQDFVEGQRFGPYRLLREIGRGGMGTVYLAERADGQFEQQVALKLMHPDFNRVQVQQRFLQERQILARLQHPHIARLYDGGVTVLDGAQPGDGQPYFVMEYVEGVPLTAYCDAKHLPVEERLRLFQQVAEAVQYAHRNLVVHRDLKPSNILVTPEGRVKLLDFGIAKVLEDEVPDLTLTQTGVRVMTPEYAAPEQVRDEPVTTATDLYALGVLLYVLLTGHRPYRFERLTPGAVEHAILEQEPERPSTRVTRPSDVAQADGFTKTVTPEAVSAARSTQPSTLRRRLSGDLDTIVLKALRKEPERRYASVEAFAEDVRRYLEGLPVAARPDTLGYRMRKLVRRHQVSVAAAMLVLTSLVGGLTVALWQGRVAAQERDRARQEAEKAEQVSSFLVNLFNVSNPFSQGAVRGDTLTARTLLARGADRIEHDLARQPALQAEMMSTIGQVYRNLNMFAEADSLLHTALAERKQLFGPRHPTVATSLGDLGQLRQDQGDYAAAESLHRASLDLRTARLGPSHPDVADSQYHLGVAVAWQRKNTEEAEMLFRQSLATRREHFGNEHLDVAYALNSLGSLLTDLERYDEAEETHREALAIRRELLDPQHPSIAISINNLAFVLRNQERYAAAEPLYREALERLRTQLGPDHLYVAVGLNNLADSMSKQGKHVEAEPLYREALAVFERLGQQGHALEAVIRSKWGACLTELGRYAKAEAALRASQPRLVEAFGENHTFVQNGRSRLDTLHAAWGRTGEAAQAHSVQR
jgi:serine/threonine-protein kinase